MFFSVIIPAYNVEDYIKKCLDSIVEQTFKDYEIIIIDDESTDKTRSIIEEYACRYSFIKFMSIEKIVVGEVRNKAISIAEGKYLLFVDADDLLENKMLETVYECLNSSESDICFLPNHYVETNIGKIENSLIPMLGNKDRFFVDNHEFVEYIAHTNGTIPASMWTAVCSRKFVDNNRIIMNNKYIWSEDSDFIYNALRYSKKVAICTYRGYVWNRNNVSSATRIINGEKVVSRLTVYKKWYDMIDDDCFGKLSSYAKEYIKKSLLKNYCDVLVIYSFTWNRKERKIIMDKFVKDSIWKIDKKNLPYGYDKYGLKLGRYVFLLNHYFTEVIKQLGINNPKKRVF